jgi:hypothetical protein
VKYIGLVIVFCLMALVFPCAVAAAGDSVYIGTTPGGGLVRKFLGIASGEVIDKVSWEIAIAPPDNKRSFQLVATYGLVEQSAPGFLNRGKTVRMEGAAEFVSQKVIRLRAKHSEVELSFALIDQNLFHLLDVDGKLMVGSEFWSYTLNRKGVGQSR